MKNKALILLIIAISVIAFVFLSVKQKPVETVAMIGKPAPDIDLIDVNQKKIRLSDLRGSVVFVNFWATWCGSCVEELPSMERMYRSLAGNPQFKIVTILYRDSIESAASFMKLNDFTFPVFLNPDETAPRRFGITGVPETFIVDKKGILRDKVVGPAEWDSTAVYSNLQGLLSEH